MAGEWREVRIADLGRVVTGRTPPRNDAAYYGREVPFLTPSDMAGHQRVQQTARSLSSLGALQLRRCLIPRGVGVSCIGWKMGKATFIDRPTITNQQINSIIVDEEVADSLFVYYSLLGRRDELFNLGAGGSRTPILNKEDFGSLLFLLPPLPEQRAIGQILGTLDDKIELNRRMNETLEAMARALFQSWFVDFDPVRARSERRAPALPKEIAELFPDRFADSDLGEIPAGWEVGTVDQEFDLTMGQSPPGETYNEAGTGLPFYQGRADFSFRFPTRRVYCTAPTRHATPGDTLVSVRAPVGDINMADEDCAIGRGVAAVRHKTGARSYTYVFLRSLEDVFARFEAEGTVFGSIGKKDFHAIRSIVPPKEIVQTFERLASPLDSRIAGSHRESQNLAALRDTLLPKLLSGELRVKDAERFVEVAI